jgi:hypothetical protein
MFIRRMSLQKYSLKTPVAIVADGRMYLINISPINQ